MPSPYTISIAGTTFEGRQNVLHALFDCHLERPNDDLKGSLEREPANTYDPNAIKVLVDGAHIGYVPKHLAAKIAPRMDTGESACVTAVTITRGDGYGVRITIEIPTKEAV